MPRIPVRTEPYTSPSRQHRHYKNKRDQVLRSLGKAAYINGSHFAIMWVSARGDVETYASEALQGRLDEWFVKQGVADEAKELVRQYRNNSSHAQPLPQPVFFDGDGDDDAFEGDDDDGHADGTMSDDGYQMGDPNQSRPGTTASSSTRTPMLPNVASDVFLDGEGPRPKLERAASTSANGLALRSRRPIAPLDTNVANDQFHRANAALGAAGPHTGLPHPFQFRNAFGYDEAGNGDDIQNFSMPYSAPLHREEASLNTQASRPGNGFASATSSLVETTFTSMAARTAFLELRFSQLQQGMCKTVAKAWIKIIEPKKQTRCPYNKGEEGKPDWWPEGVRHKEPDHLMKPERHALLLTILRSPRVKVARLQLATAEVVALIKADKVSLLMDVYRVAREEEKMREAGVDLDSSTTVAISTMEGWSEEGQCVIDTERPASPGAVPNAAEMDDESANGKIRKRTGTQLARSASASQAPRRDAHRDKRRVMDGNVGQPSASGTFDNHLFVPSATSFPAANASTSQKRSGNQAQTWLLHEPTQFGVKRTSISSHTLSSSAQQRSAAANGQTSSQHALHEQYGLITPLTANTQLMDPSFLAAVKGNNTFGNGHNGEVRAEGYMSAPTGHAQLHPHDAPYGQHAALQQHHVAHQHQQPASNQQQYYYELHAGHGQHDSPIMQELGHQHMQPNVRQQSGAQSGSDLFASYPAQPQAGSVANGALGLQGIGIHWNQAAGYPSNFDNQEVDNTLGWWNGGAMTKQNAIANSGLTEPAFDNSFASTIDSGGPSTPPQVPGSVAPGGDKAGSSWNDTSMRTQIAQIRAEPAAERTTKEDAESGLAKAQSMHVPTGAQTASFESWMFANQAQSH